MRNLLVATLAGAGLVAGVASTALAGGPATVLEARGSVPRAALSTVPTLIPVPTFTTAPAPTSSSTPPTPPTTDPVCESCECSSDEAPAPTLAGSALLLANASFARLPVDKAKKVCVVVTVKGDDDDPKNPGTSVALDPNDGGLVPTVRVATADPAKKQYVIALNIAQRDQPRSFSGCSFARYGKGSAPAEAKVDYNEAIWMATLTSEGFKFGSADKFTVRFTCYRP